MPTDIIKYKLHTKGFYKAKRASILKTSNLNSKDLAAITSQSFLLPVELT